MIRRVMVSMVLATGVAIVGCDNAGSQTSQATGQSAAEVAEPLPATLALASAPGQAKDVAEVKASARPGDRVVVRGVVAGSANPISASRAILTLLDANINTCEKSEGDACKTPWDACCEPGDVLVKNTLTVQVVDAEGHPLKGSFSSLPGVKPLARLVITGTAQSTPDGAVLLVNADGVFVEK